MSKTGIHVRLEAGQTDAEVVHEARQRLEETLPNYYGSTPLQVMIAPCKGYNGVRNLPLEMMNRTKELGLAHDVALSASVLRVLYSKKLTPKRKTSVAVLYIATATHDGKGHCIATPVDMRWEPTFSASYVYDYINSMQLELSKAVPPHDGAALLNSILLSILQSGIIPDRKH